MKFGKFSTIWTVFWQFLVCFDLFWPILNCLGYFGPIWTYLDPFQPNQTNLLQNCTICTQLNPFGSIWATLDHFGPNQTHWDPFGLIWSHLKPFEAIWRYLEAFRAIWNHTEPFAALFNHLKPFGSIRSHLEPFEAIWMHLQSLGAIWCYLEQFGQLELLRAAKQSLLVYFLFWNWTHNAVVWLPLIIRRALLLVAVILHPPQRPINLACSVILLSTVLFCTAWYFSNSWQWRGLYCLDRVHCDLHPASAICRRQWKPGRQLHRQEPVAKGL